MDRVICIQPGDQIEQLFGAGVCGQAMFQGADADLFCAQDLVAHVDLAGRVAADQDHRQGRLDVSRAQAVDVLADLDQHPGGGGFAVNQSGCVHRKITVLSWLRKTRCSRWYLTALDRATVSVSRPVATRSSGR